MAAFYGEGIRRRCRESECEGVPRSQVGSKPTSESAARVERRVVSEVDAKNLISLNEIIGMLREERSTMTTSNSIAGLIGPTLVAGAVAFC
jgi:hypothetical protein